MRPREGGPIAFAGLWETWMGPNGEEMETAIIITTAAKGELARLHERMPVIVPPDAFDLWLDCSKVDAMTAAALFAPAPEGLLEAYEISPAVNHTGNDGPNLIEPAAWQPPPVLPPANSGASAPARRAARRTRGSSRCFDPPCGGKSTTGAVYNTLPGLRMPLGSSVRLSVLIRS